jgi:hypothetical protein
VRQIDAIFVIEREINGLPAEQQVTIMFPLPIRTIAMLDKGLSERFITELVGGRRIGTRSTVAMLGFRLMSAIKERSLSVYWGLLAGKI